MTINRILVFLIYATLFFAVLSALSCSKMPNEENRYCYFACLISDKYTADSVFVVRDTLWKDNCLTKYWWDRTKTASDSMTDMFKHCNPFYRNGYLVERERMFYVLNPAHNVTPKIY